MHSRRGGVTLIELVVVIAIMAMLLCLAIVFFKGANRDLGVTASAYHVTGLIRRAHEHARSASSPAWVVLDLKANAVHLLHRETVGEWHFEDTGGAGALGRNASISGGSLVPGRVGQALQLAGSGSINCGEVPVFAIDQGIAIEFWYLRRPTRTRHTLCAIDRHVEMFVEADGKLSAHVGQVEVNTRDLRLPVDTWSHIQLVYGAGSLRLLVNEVVVAMKAGKSEWGKSAPLVMGGKGGMGGAIDELRIGLIIPSERYELPREAKFELPAGTAVPDEGFLIQFDTEGRLDRARHAREVRFTIKSPAKKAELVVGPGGTLLPIVWSDPPPPPPPKTPAPAPAPVKK